MRSAERIAEYSTRFRVSEHLADMHTEASGSTARGTTLMPGLAREGRCSASH